MRYEDYRKFRGVLLEKHLLLTKLKFPAAKHIVGIATESGRGSGGSEDAAYFDAREWSNELEEEAKLIEAELKEFGLVGNSKEIKGNVKEYPYDEEQLRDFQKLKGRAKNLPCVCGSGKKFKKCHGSNN